MRDEGETVNLRRSRRGNQQETLRQKDRIWTKLWKAAGQRRRGENLSGLQDRARR